MTSATGLNGASISRAGTCTAHSCSLMFWEKVEREGIPWANRRLLANQKAGGLLPNPLFFLFTSKASFG